jgi:ABC-2 type transport system ATP-binding protein
MIRVDRVSKAFGARLALDSVSLAVQRGEVLALLGHNGAGKSTLFALILGLLQLTSGDISVHGTSVRRHPRRARRGIGSVLAPAFYEYLSGWDNLRVLTSYSGPVADADMVAVVHSVGLGDRIHDRVCVYSHGMRRRLALAQALLPRPDVLLLDEWETGLDPEGMRELQALVLRLNRDEGMTVVVSSHQPAGVVPVADRVAILRQGRLIFAGRWTDLDGGVSAVRLDLDDWARAAPALERLGAKIGVDHVVALAPSCNVADVVAALVRVDVRVRAVEPIGGTAEDRYLRALARATTAARDAAVSPRR